MKGGKYLEKRHVKDVYDTIAPSFNDIPQKVWPNVKKFIKGLSPGSLVADIGCGNGRYLHLNNGVLKFGVDVCLPLVELSQEKGYEVLVADNQYLPFKENSFDAVISIGVLHHFSTEERRINGLRELCRILKPGGKLLVYVWAYEQKHRRFDGQDVLVPWHAGKRKRRPKDFCHSDQDISSTSSISEDDSLGSAEKPFLQRTVSDPVCQYCPPRKPYNLIQSRQRSNTLPSSLEGYDGCYHGNSQIEDECRKIQMSLSKMAASSLDSVFSDTKIDLDEPIIFDTNVAESILDDKTHNLACVEDKTGIEKHFQCQQFSEMSSFNQSQTQNVKCTSKKKTKKMSLFETLRTKFLKFINAADNMNAVIDSEETTIGNNAGVMSSQYNPMNQDIGHTEFAVREFPMSSYPTYRVDIDKHGPSESTHAPSIEHRDIINNGFSKQTPGPSENTHAPSIEHRDIINNGFSKQTPGLSESTYAPSIEHRDIINNGFSKQTPGPSESTYAPSIQHRDIINNGFSKQTSDTELKLTENSHTNYSNRKEINSSSIQERGCELKILNTFHTQLNKLNSTLSDDFPGNGDSSQLKHPNHVIHSQSKKLSRSSGHTDDSGMRLDDYTCNLNNTAVNGSSGYKDDFELNLCDSIHTRLHKVIDSNSGHQHDSKLKHTKINLNSEHENDFESKRHGRIHTQKLSNALINGNLGHKNDSDLKLDGGTPTKNSTMKANLDHENDSDLKLNGGTPSQKPSSLINGKHHEDDSEMLQYGGASNQKTRSSIINGNSDCGDGDELKLHGNTDNLFNVSNRSMVNGISGQGNTLHNNVQTKKIEYTQQSLENISHNKGQTRNIEYTQRSLENISSSDPSLSSSVVPSQRLCRYYHVFRDGELSALIENHVDSLTIASCLYDHGNWCMIANKLGK